MIKIDTFEGVKATVQNFRFQFLAAVVLAAVTATFSGCGPSSTPSSNNGSPIASNEAAATVNGKDVKMEDVERGLKQQAQGQEAKLSPLELAQARLQILDQLIQGEVMFQKAEKEGTVPTDEDVTAEFNKTKTGSNMSQEQFDKAMQESGQTEASARETIKRKLASDKLIEKITARIEPPKDSEIDAFYAGNKSAFVKKKGVKLAAIVIDPKNGGEGDTTVDEQSAVLKANEIVKQIQSGEDFAKVAGEKSEDQTKFQGGDLGYLSEEDVAQAFSPQIAAGLMNPGTKIGQILPTRAQGKLFILKLQERNDKDEDLTLESPGIREQVTKSLVDARKQLLAASYQALAMNDAKIVNILAQKVVDNPNELSGARPAGADTPSNSNTNSTNSNSANANTANANSKNVNAAAANKPAVNTAVKPANTNANTNTNK